MLKWKGFDKTLLIKHTRVLIIWGLFILFSIVYIILTSKGDLNIYFSNNYNRIIGYVARFYTNLGEEWLLIPICIFLLFMVRSSDFTIRIILTFVFNTLITLPLKYYLFNINRPRIFLEKFNLNFTDGVDVYQYHSFPSGHSSVAFAVALALAFWFKNKTVSSVVIALAIGVGFSRIYLQQHFIEDVCGGAIIGLISAWLASGFQWVPKGNTNIENGNLKPD